jgi:hypothetical protein
MSEQRLLGSYVYTRLMLLFQFDRGRLEARLPAGWQLMEGDDGVVAFGFCTIVHAQGANGEPQPAPRNRYLPLNGAAQHADSGEVANWFYWGCAAEPDRLLGWGQAPYNPFVPARFEAEEQRHGEGTDATVSERYRIDLSDGQIQMEAIYRPGGKVERLAWSRPISTPFAPEFRLRYENEDLQDVVLDAEDGVSRVERIDYRVEVPALADLFDGSERLVSVVAAPFSERRVFWLR